MKNQAKTFVDLNVLMWLPYQDPKDPNSNYYYKSLIEIKWSTKKLISDILDSYFPESLKNLTRDDILKKKEFMKMDIYYEIKRFWHIISLRNYRAIFDQKDIDKALLWILENKLSIFFIIVNEFEYLYLDRNSWLKTTWIEKIIDMLRYNSYSQFQHCIDDTKKLWKIIWLNESDWQYIIKEEIKRFLTKPISCSDHYQVQGYPLEKSKLLKENFNISTEDFYKIVYERINYNIKKWCNPDAEAIIIFFWLEKELKKIKINKIDKSKKLIIWKFSK
jgi:hypothetical protein